MDKCENKLINYFNQINKTVKQQTLFPLNARNADILSPQKGITDPSMFKPQTGHMRK